MLLCFSSLHVSLLIPALKGSFPGFCQKFWKSVGIFVHTTHPSSVYARVSLVYASSVIFFSCSSHHRGPRSDPREHSYFSLALGEWQKRRQRVSFHCGFVLVPTFDSPAMWMQWPFSLSGYVSTLLSSNNKSAPDDDTEKGEGSALASRSLSSG